MVALFCLSDPLYIFMHFYMLDSCVISCLVICIISCLVICIGLVQLRQIASLSYAYLCILLYVLVVISLLCDFCALSRLLLCMLTTHVVDVNIILTTPRHYFIVKQSGIFTEYCAGGLILYFCTMCADTGVERGEEFESSLCRYISVTTLNCHFVHGRLEPCISVCYISKR